MSNPDNFHETKFEDLTPDQRKALIRLANSWAKVEGWCLINKAIGKLVIIGGLGVIILVSQSVDAIKNLLRGFGKQ